MTNPTSNFGWQMPENTDLVTNLPADFEVFGQAVDTDFVDLLGGTTGQVLSKTSGTDLDFTWVAQSAGMTNPMTTTGDSIYSSSGSTPARLGIGTTGQVLTVASGLPSWATPASGAGLILVNATNFTTAGAVAVDNVFTSTYENYRIILKLNYVSTAMAVKFNFRVGGTSNTTSNYSYAAYKNLFASASLTSYDTGASTSYFYIGEASGTFTGSYDVISPQSATKKFINGLAVQSAAGYSHQGFFDATTSFDGFEITLSSGNISGTVYTYGYAK